jgi:hypothetical protein
MLSFQGTPDACGPVSRRGFLRVGALGGALTLADLLRLRAAADGRAAPRPPDKAAILVWLPGGPSHLDTFDPKPEAPAEVRGEFATIPSGITGVRLCELLPRHARCMEHLTVLRAVTGGVDEHSDNVVMSGWGLAENERVGRPPVGAVVSKLRSAARPDVPQFVSLRGLTKGLEPGYLGLAHRAFAPPRPGVAGTAGLTLPAGVDAERLGERRGLLKEFDQLRRDIDASGTMAGMDAYTERAFEMMTSGVVRRALDLDREDLRTRERYGKHGTQLLLARRLVEAGVGCVTAQVGSPIVGMPEWDTHDNNFPILRRLLPQLDLGVSALVEDLHQRGLAEEVVVLVCGEMGRTPRINGRAGRDHWPAVMSCVLAGGGLRTGQVVGSTTSRGEEAKERPYSVQRVLATVYRCLGIDPGLTFPDRTGRPQYLLDDRDPIPELT